jgi:CDP-diacylglycerol--serine O-phosphatidyltransferase
LASLMIKRFANLLTFLNLVFGSISILYTINGNNEAAAVFILLAVLMDSIDGKVARKLKISSDLGRELDSLSDMVSFGVAPAVLLHSQVLLVSYNILGLVATLVFIGCGAYRLARFNVLNSNNYFMGLPITAAGGILAIFSMIAANLYPLVILLLILALSFLMISTIKIPKI